MAVVSIKLDGQDNATAKIKQVEKSLNDLGKNAGKSFDLGNITDQLGNLGSAGGIANALGGALSTAIPVAGLGIAAGAAASAAWELGKLGSESLRTKQAFNDLAAQAGTSGQAMLTAMRLASSGTVADTELMAAASRALVLGVTDDAKTMAALVQAAIVKGQQVGVGASQAVNDLVTGIGRMSPEILDNLGIANAKSAFDDYAKTLGTTADKLTDVQKKQALVSSVLASTQGASVADDAAASFERMDAALQNAKSALGELFSPAIAVVAENIANAARDATDAITTSAVEAAQSNLFTFGEEVSKLYNKYKDLEALAATAELGGDTARLNEINASLAQVSTQLGVYVGNYNEAAKVTGAPLIDPVAIKQGELATMDAAAAEEQLAVSTQVATAAAAGSTIVMEGVRSKLAELAGQANATGSALRSAWVGAAGALGAAQAFAGFQTAQKQLEGLRTEWNYMGLTSEQMAFKEAEFLDNNNGKIQDQIKLIDDSTSAMKSHGGAVSAVSSQYNDMASKVSSALQGATSLDPIGVNPSDYLPRADAVQEDAFRLADIMVKGFDSPWVDYIKNKFPKMWDEMAAGGDIQAGAAKVLQQFQQGMRPELLNLDQLKEAVKAQLTSEQAFAGMADQITQQLVGELGVSAGQVQGALAGVVGSLPGGAKLSEQLGGEEMTGTGNGSGSAFATGFSASANGATLVTTITAQMTAVIAQFNQSGRTAGEQWSSGFYAVAETSLAGPLIDLLVTLVTPGVMAQMAAGTSRNEAK